MQLHLLDPGHCLDPALQFTGLIFQLVHGNVIAIDGEQHAIHLGELVLHYADLGLHRQLQLDVLDLAAQQVPLLGQLVGAVFLLQIDEDHRTAGTGEGSEFPQRPHLLDLGLYLVGDQLFDLLGGGARVEGDDDGALHREGGVFQLAQIEIGVDPCDGAQGGKEDDEGLLPDGEQ